MGHYQVRCKSAYTKKIGKTNQKFIKALYLWCLSLRKYIGSEIVPGPKAVDRVIEWYFIGEKKIGH